jgi:hypothetical protein
MVGLNDMKRNGSATKTLNKFDSALRAMIFKCIRGATQYSGNDTVVTRSNGVFTAYAASSVGGTGSGVTLGAGQTSASFSATLGAKWSHSFTGDSIGVQLFGTDGSLYTLGECDIMIDGVKVKHVNCNDGWYDGISDGAYDNGRGPIVFIFTNLGYSNHTIEIINTNGVSVAVDFFSQILSPSECPTILIAEIPYCSLTGYNSPAFGSRYHSNVCSKLMKEIVIEYRNLGYNIGWVNTTDYYTPRMSDDGTHPDNSGYDRLTSAFVAACK